MKTLTQDIIVTLCFKLVLLVLLWLICIKDVGKNTIDLPQWLYGVTVDDAVISAKTTHYSK